MIRNHWYHRSSRIIVFNDWITPSPQAGSVVVPVLPVAGYTGWWRAGVGVYTDVDGTTAASNSDAIARWNDSSGNGNNMLQATLSRRPTYETSYLAGYPGVLFDGVDDFLNCGGLSDNPSTLIIVGRFVTQVFGQRIAGYGQTRSVFDNAAGEGDSGFGYYQGTAPSILVDIGGNARNNCIVVARLETGVSNLSRINSGNSAGINCFENPTSTLGLGGNGNTLATLEVGNCYLVEAIHYPTILNDSDCELIEAYLNAKYGVY